MLPVRGKQFVSLGVKVQPTSCVPAPSTAVGSSKAKVPLTAVSILMLVAGAKLFVAGAVRTAELLHVSNAVIGLTVVALGTSLPELATSVAAALRGECDIAIGNVVGSNLFNVLCILGIAPLVSPIAAGKVNHFDFALMAACGILLWVMMKTGKAISRREGAGLLLIYILYMAKLALRPEWGAKWF